MSLDRDLQNKSVIFSPYSLYRNPSLLYFGWVQRCSLGNSSIRRLVISITNCVFKKTAKTWFFFLNFFFRALTIILLKTYLVVAPIDLNCCCLYLALLLQASVLKLAAEIWKEQYPVNCLKSFGFSVLPGILWELRCAGGGRSYGSAGELAALLRLILLCPLLQRRRQVLPWACPSLRISDELLEMVHAARFWSVGLGRGGVHACAFKGCVIMYGGKGPSWICWC